MQTINVMQGQTLADIAIRYCGSIEALFQLAVLNDISITDALEAGTVLLLPPPLDKGVINYFECNGIQPASK